MGHLLGVSQEVGVAPSTAHVLTELPIVPSLQDLGKIQYNYAKHGKLHAHAKLEIGSIHTIHEHNL